MRDHTEAEHSMFMSLSTLHNSCYNYITRLVSGNIRFHSKHKIRTCCWLNLSKFTHFLGGPNRPKICCVGRTKPDFKDRAESIKSSTFFLDVTRASSMPPMPRNFILIVLSFYRTRLTYFEAKKCVNINFTL